MTVTVIFKSMLHHDLTRCVIKGLLYIKSYFVALEGLFSVTRNWSQLYLSTVGM